jgi:hypothetical protein
MLVETTPKVVLPNIVSGQPNCRVFVRLKASAQNSARARSRILKFLETAISAFFCGAARSSLRRRGELPIV